jgi:hypothetical protein
MFVLTTTSRQRKAIKAYGSPQLRSWLAGTTLKAPDAASAWAHLSDVVQAAAKHGDDRGEAMTLRLSTQAVRQACKERNQ